MSSLNLCSRSKQSRREGWQQRGLSPSRHLGSGRRRCRFACRCCSHRCPLLLRLIQELPHRGASLCDCCSHLELVILQSYVGAAIQQQLHHLRMAAGGPMAGGQRSEDM